MTATETLWTLEDLEIRWKAVGKTPKNRRKWVLRRVKAWCIPSDGARYNPRFLPAEVLRAEQREMGGRRR